MNLSGSRDLVPWAEGPRGAKLSKEPNGTKGVEL